ncbi:hypothetical protein J1N35_031194 [Gossypium stocksii]|uniref:Uncharacterized protein n=1 Tax=Gossypium stocksii TaxID=47602 RepID=A0A9D3V1X7_9ROSI|nr:hypothetical protein J1N35_031194 [Gossypium stocksii]
MATEFKMVSEQEDGVVENQGVVKGKKGGSKDFVKIIETRMTEVESSMSDVQS